LRRIASGVPRNLIFEHVQNDLFRLHRSLYTFIGGFAVGRRVLYDAQQGPFAGRRIHDLGAAATTVVVRPRRARMFASKRYGTKTLHFVSRAPDKTFYDLIVTNDSADDSIARLRQFLYPNGKVIVVVKPASNGRNESIAAGRYRQHFRVVRRFEHASTAELDLHSPLPSKLSDIAFTFSELLVEEPPSGKAIGVIYLLTDDEKWRHSRLHLGCGPVSLEGWINIDNQPYAGIDFRWDLAQGIPFIRNRFIYAEHFLEHLSYEQVELFLPECRKSLAEDGILRLSTPNLDWVWVNQYRPSESVPQEEALRDCFVLNRAFRGWGHQFLYNFVTLRATLEAAGFADIRSYRYGESEIADLVGIERHEQYPDTPDLPHILIAEARGRCVPPPNRVTEPYRAEYLRDVAAR
jgi:predicted SAM-dependent methyltransferase